MATGARERLFEAGLALFDELAPATLHTGLTVSALARRARTTRATFYHHWPTLDAYVADLAAWAFDPGRAHWHTTEHDEFARFLAAKGDAETIRASGVAEVERVLADPATTLRLRLTAHPGDEHIRGALEQYYRALDRSAVDATKVLWGLWGRVPREPFDYDSIAVLWAALVDGLVMRKRANPEFDAPTLYGNALLVMAPALSRDQRDGLDLDAWAAEVVDGFWASTAQTRPAPTTTLSRSEVADRVIPSVLALLENQPWSEITVRAVADRCGLGEEAVLDAFGSKAGIAALVLAAISFRQVSALPVAPNPVDDLRQTLGAARGVIRRQRALAAATLMVVTANAPGPRAETIVSMSFTHDRIAASIERAQQQGLVRADLAALPMAIHWSRMVLLEQVAPGIAGVDRFDVVDFLVGQAGTADPS